MVPLHAWYKLCCESLVWNLFPGPFRFVDSYGAQKLADKFHEFREVYGEHFEAAPMLLDYAKQGKTFYK